MQQKHPLPPFTLETASQKVQMAEDDWNSKNPEKLALAYSIDTELDNGNLIRNTNSDYTKYAFTFEGMYGSPIVFNLLPYRSSIKLVHKYNSPKELSTEESK